MTVLKAWIKIVPENEAEGLVAEAYENYKKRLNWIPKDSAILSLKPKMMKAFHGVSMEMRSVENNLTPARREQIAFLTSVINRCTYWCTHHGEALRKQMNWSIDQVVAFAEDWRSVPGLSERERVTLDYIEKVTYTDKTATREDIDNLRRVGLSDEEVLEATIVTCFYNWVNRLVDNLGVTIEEGDAEANHDMLRALVQNGIVPAPD